MSDIVWSYRDADWVHDRDLVGYDVEARDGRIGTIHSSSTDAGAQRLVVDTGTWSFGKKRTIPAGSVVGVDHESGLVIVDLTKEQVRSGPDHDADAAWDDDARDRYAGHYAPQPDR